MKGEDWLGCVTADDYDSAMKEAEKNPDFKGFTHVEERGPNSGHSGAI